MSPKQARKETEKILVVDDDPDFRDSVCSFLRANHMSVLEAGDADEGLRVALAERPDVIIMDIMMNERTEGLFAVQRIRRTPGLERTAVFVVSSMYSHVSGLSISPERAWMGHDEFFAKPVDMLSLLDKIREYAGKAAIEPKPSERK
jgi:CheY-like chemotaxis protein